MSESMPRRRRLVASACLVILLVLAGVLAWLGAGPTSWTLRATLAGATDDRAWAHVPAGRPMVGACDVQALLSSSIARELRPRLDALAARNGFDSTLAERNVRLLVLSGEGIDFGYAVASGFRLSPLLLSRFARPWQAMPFSEGGRQWRAATDGSTVLVPLEPGIVAWIPVGVDPSRVAASLELAAADPREPIALEGAALRGVVEVDDRLRAQAARQVPRNVSALLAALVRIDCSLRAGEALDLEMTLTHRDAAGATATAALLQNANMMASLVRGTGGLASLLGGDAALLAQLPPLTIAQDGPNVVVKATADAAQVEAWIDLAEREVGL